MGVTCLGAAHAMLARTTFDICIVDEATQVCFKFTFCGTATHYLRLCIRDPLDPAIEFCNSGILQNFCRNGLKLRRCFIDITESNMYASSII